MSRRGFSPEEASEELARSGGFSMKAGSGRRPHSGRMVSDYGAESVVEGVAKPAQIQEYVGRRGRSLSQPGKYVGGWVEGGKTFLDESRRHLDADKAIRAGQANAQHGVYDIDRDRVINPFGAGIKYRGTLFEHLSRNERRRVSTSNASLRIAEMRKGFESVHTSTDEKDAGDFSGDQKMPAGVMTQPKQLRLRGMG